MNRKSKLLAIREIDPIKEPTAFASDAEVDAVYDEVCGKKISDGIDKKIKMNVFAGKKEIDKTLLLTILEQINDELARNELQATFNIFGGCAVMLTCYSGRRSWDIDGVMTGPNVQLLSNIIDKVVERNQNSESAFSRSLFDMTIVGVFHLMSKDDDMVVYEQMSNLKIQICSARQLLAMKLFSARLDKQFQDLKDAVLLCRHLELTNKYELRNVLDEYFKKESIDKKNKNIETLNSINTFILEVVKELKL